VTILPCLTLALLTASDPTPGEVPQWGGFRGNNGAGLSLAQGLPASLDPETNLVWRVDVPSGYSSPTVAGKDLYLTGSDGKSKLYTLCLDADTGETRWQRELGYDGSRPGANSPAAPSPVTDGERVYTLFHHLGLVVYDREGEELWRKPIGPFNIPHGMSTSPVLWGDLVILQVDQDQNAYLIAWDRRTGAERWKVERPGVTHSYATPAVFAPADGRPQLVVSGSFQIAGYDLEKGEKLWWVDGAAWQSKSIPVFAENRCLVNSFMPTLADMQMPAFSGEFEEVLVERDLDGNEKISKSEWEDARLHQIWFIFDLDGDDELDATEWEFALSANKAYGGLFAIDMGGKGDVTASHVKWKLDDRRELSDVTSPVVVGGTMFTIREGGLLAAFDVASGELVKQERVGESDEYYASPVAGDGKLYLASLSGQLAVVRAEPEWELLGTSRLEDQELWATPALAGRQVYVRGKTALFCFEDPQ